MQTGRTRRTNPDCHQPGLFSRTVRSTSHQAKARADSQRLLAGAAGGRANPRYRKNLPLARRSLGETTHRQGQTPVSPGPSPLVAPRLARGDIDPLQMGLAVAVCARDTPNVLVVVCANNARERIVWTDNEVPIRRRTGRGRVRVKCEHAARNRLHITRVQLRGRDVHAGAGDQCSDHYRHRRVTDTHVISPLLCTSAHLVEALLIVRNGCRFL